MFQVNVGSNRNYQVQKSKDGFILNGDIEQLDFVPISDRKYQVISQNKVHLIEVVEFNKAEKSLKLKVNDKGVEVKLKSNLDQLLEKLGLDSVASTGMKDLKAPMPGLILKINVTEGQEVKKGDPLIILEAMKMENVIKAMGDATLSSVLVKEGQSVEKNQVLMNF